MQNQIVNVLPDQLQHVSLLHAVKAWPAEPTLQGANPEQAMASPYCGQSQFPSGASLFHCMVASSQPESTLSASS